METPVRARPARPAHGRGLVGQRRGGRRLLGGLASVIVAVLVLVLGSQASVSWAAAPVDQVAKTLTGSTSVAIDSVLSSAADFYVDKTSASCSDSGTGTQNAPFCTITKGVSQLQAGSTLYIGSGSYPETIRPSISGTASAPITITSWPGRSPVIGNGVANGANISAK